ncbi:putative KpsF/GutQ family protein [Magnetofaba australis IT-1]|uniref:Putative KpsF/GutQ family protein n=2 Tax=Magnetofaba TaxID=1472292 RepID=A0A1Y2K1Z4_9PROT|nr:KpsF/GutQ family sugar-phosphate isomerase [Magnetofaba australis]OSM01626.1 putative KpsF/GutQ family protein [Magnetofaba australis IT-1]
MLEQAREVLILEAEAIRAVADRLDARFEEAVRVLLACQGRVVATGMGKSGLIAQKVAATLASTGTPSLFLHPGDGSHGDLGMVTQQDVVLAFSNSGETEEVLALLPVIKRLGAGLISLVGELDSTLGRMSDVALDVSVAREACPLNLAPTSSTTAALALGDALAVALLTARGFDEERFALFHPGGSLGRKLLLTVRRVMHAGEEIPLVDENAPLREALLEMTAKRLGLTGVRSADGALVGVITDGDLRRHLEWEAEGVLSATAKQMMTRNPKTIEADALAAEALRVMQQGQITSLFVMDRGALAGVVHLHDLLRAGLA